eukprot:scaffold47327_cov46-Attheya_sp.AAC.1
MVSSICAEKGSCRSLQHKQTLLEEDSCPACKDLQKYSISFLRKPENRKLWHGVCQRKNPPNDGSYVPKNRLLDETTTGRVGPRSRKQTKHFVAAPAGKAKMVYEMSGKAYLSKKVMYKIRNDPDPRIDRAYAERCIDKENQEKESMNQNAKKIFVTIPKGGTSKSARSKQNRMLGAIINQTSKALAQDKATPNRYRAEGIENAKKDSPAPQPETAPYQKNDLRVSFQLSRAPICSLAKPSVQRPTLTSSPMFTPTCQATFCTPRCLSSILRRRNQETRTKPTTIMPTVTKSPIPGMRFEEVEEPAECADDELGPRVAEICGGSHHKKRRRGPPIKNEKVEAVKRLIGEFNLDRLEQMTKNEQRRPILAIVAEQYNRSVVQEATGIKMSEKEFSKTRKHARWPGPMEPV